MTWPERGPVPGEGLFAVFADLHARRSTTRLEVNKPGFSAHVDFVDGKVTGASYHHHVGRKAFARTCRVSSGQYECVRLPGTASAIAPFAELMKAARRLDEMVRTRAEAVGGLERVWDVRFAALKRVLRDIPDEVNPILRLLDGRRSVGEIIEVSAHDERLVLRVLHRLLRMGILILPDAYVHAAAGYELTADGAADGPAVARIEPTWFDTSPPVPVSSPPAPAPGRVSNVPRFAEAELDDVVIPPHPSMLPQARQEATTIPAAADAPVDDNPTIPEAPAPAVHQEPAPPAPAAAKGPVVVEEPVAEQQPLVDDEPIAKDEPVADAPVVADEPAVENEPVADEPVAAHEPVADEPAVEHEPDVADAPAVEDEPVAADEPPVEGEPVVEDEPVVDQQPNVEDPPQAADALDDGAPAAPVAGLGTDGPRLFGEGPHDEDKPPSVVEHTAPYPAAAAAESSLRPLPDSASEDADADTGAPEVEVTAWSVPPHEVVPGPRRGSAPPRSATVGGAAADVDAQDVVSTPPKEAFEHDKAALESWLTEEDAFFADRASRYELAQEEKSSRIALVMAGLFVIMLVAFAIYGAVQFARRAEPMAPAKASDLFDMASEAIEGGDPARGCRMLDEIKRGVRHESDIYRRTWNLYEENCR